MLFHRILFPEHLIRPVEGFLALSGFYAADVFVDVHAVVRNFDQAAGDV